MKSLFKSIERAFNTFERLFRSFECPFKSLEREKHRASYAFSMRCKRNYIPWLLQKDRHSPLPCSAKGGRDVARYISTVIGMRILR